MANHCIDVVCVGCGRTWCLRGCNYNHGRNPRAAAKAQKRFYNATPKPFTWNERCCKDSNGQWWPICSDSLIMGND